MSDMGKKPQNIVIEPKGFVVNVSPLGFIIYAKEFFNTARSFKSTKPFSPLPYYLFCHALELSLKGFLLAKGISKKDLQKREKVGHDLLKVLDEAIARGLDKIVPVSAMQRNEIAKANDYYLNKYFEYFEVIKAVTGYPDLPDMAILEKLISDIIEKVEPVCASA
jgi:hypothetical protein